MNNKIFLVSGAIMGLVGVMIGAFGAHGLKELLDATDRMETFETGVRYQMYHAFTLLFTGWVMANNPAKALRFAGWAFLLGILVFSGSLYALCLLNQPKLGMVTPFGGVLFLIGWGLLVYHFLTSKTQ